MKNMTIIIMMLILFSGCGDEKQSEQETSIYGTWQLVESYVVSGVEGEWEQVENGYQYDIHSNMTFVSNQFSECAEGVFVLSDTEISFSYECEGFTTGIESPAGTFTYQYALSNGQLSLTPTYLSCDEGCGYKFDKIAEPQTGD